MYDASGRPPGAHAKGYNQHSIGVCYEGGLDEQGRPADTRTELQKRSLRVLVRVLAMDFQTRRIVGHRDLSPDLDGDGVIEPEEWTKVFPALMLGRNYKKIYVQCYNDMFLC